jgi:hypothetical protein
VTEKSDVSVAPKLLVSIEWALWDSNPGPTDYEGGNGQSVQNQGELLASPQQQLTACCSSVEYHTELPKSTQFGY